MGDSLQDQLRALGLAKKKSADRRAGAKNRPRKSSRSKSRPETKPGGEMSLQKAWALKERDEQKTAEIARRKKQEEDRKRRALNKAIRVIVEAHRLNRVDAELSRNFLYKGRIRKVRATGEQLSALNRGELGVVYLSGAYHILPAEQVEAVRALSAEHVPDLGGADSDDGDHPVPEDLTW